MNFLFFSGGQFDPVRGGQFGLVYSGQLKQVGGGQFNWFLQVYNQRRAKVLIN
jgi:hypothetical protein